MTEAEYLDHDASHDGKHEFVNGELFAMSGATEAHSLIASNLHVSLGLRLRGGVCRVHGPDLRVRIDETGLYGYPDLTVVCGQPLFAPTHPESLLNPAVLIEVLSASTEQYDRGAKLEHYRRRASVRCVLLVDSRERRVSSYARNADGTWTLIDHTDGEVSITALAVSLPLDEIYEGAEQARGWGP